jgi:enoyl-CoA hydratase/carnithine racemase
MPIIGARARGANNRALPDATWSGRIKEDVDLALQHRMRARESDEAREGIAAFNEKRAPKWAN